MRARVAGCAPQGGATEQQDDAERNSGATGQGANADPLSMSGCELRAQLRAQQERNYSAIAGDCEPSRVAPVPSESLHYRWCVVMPDGRAFEVCCLPELTAAEMRELYRGATVQPLPNAPDGEAGQLPAQMPMRYAPRTA